MKRTQNEYRILASELKRVLKERRMTYKDLAKELGLSEAGVKRIFLKSDGKVSTLARISEALGFSFVDLVSSSKLNAVEVQYLTAEQEEFFTKNFHFYVFFNELVIRKKNIAAIQADHDLPAQSLRKYLRALEKLDLIEVGRHGRIKFKVKEPVGFLKEGRLLSVVQQRFTRSVATSLSEMGSALIKDGRELFTREWALSQENYLSLTREVESLVKQYDRTSARDHALLEQGDLVTVSLLIGMLPNQSPYPRIQEI